MAELTLVVLAVGTTHPLNIAGLGLDARAAGLLGIRLVTVVAGVSAQRADSVLARSAVDPGLIALQFASLRDVRVDAVHIGALLDAASVAAVAAGIATMPGVPTVCDPVITASNGGRLADDATVDALRHLLFGRCSLITPNIDEAAVMLGHPVAGVDAMAAAAREFVAGGSPAVLLKGGHLNGDPTDVFADASGVHHFSAPRIDRRLRGTGDLLACAIAARLAHGDDLRSSIETARMFVRGCLHAGVRFAGAATIP